MVKPEITVLVAAHKPYWVPADPAYLPIQVGTAVPGHKLISGFQSDSEGENISEKNPNYCELTALYWAWKNLEVEYVGLSHYRRYFKGSGERGIATGKELLAKLSSNTVLAPKRRHYYIETIYDHYIHAHHREPLDMSLSIIRRDYPDYAASCDTVMNRRWLYIFNMFVMSKEHFDAYCRWLFPILQEVESNIDIRDWATYESRVYGFLSERLFNIWLDANGLTVKELPYVFLESQNWPKKITNFLKRKIRGNNEQ